MIPLAPDHLPSTGTLAVLAVAGALVYAVTPLIRFTAGAVAVLAVGVLLARAAGIL